MSKLLKSVALRNNLNQELEVLMKWNETQKDKPLNCFNNLWLSLKSVTESEYMLNVAERIKRELGSKYSVIIYNVLAMYGNNYAKLALADMYARGDGLTSDITLAEKYYKDCLTDTLLKPIVAVKLDELYNESYSQIM